MPPACGPTPSLLPICYPCLLLVLPPVPVLPAHALLPVPCLFPCLPVLLACCLSLPLPPCLLLLLFTLLALLQPTCLSLHSSLPQCCHNCQEVANIYGSNVTRGSWEASLLAVSHSLESVSVSMSMGHGVWIPFDSIRFDSFRVSLICLQLVVCLAMTWHVLVLRVAVAATLIGKILWLKCRVCLHSMVVIGSTHDK